MKKTPKASGRKEGKETVAAIDAIGIDIGDKVSQFCRLGVGGEVADRQRFHTNTESLKRHFAKLQRARIALELARLARADVRLLNVVYVRSLECRLDFMLL